MSEPTKISSFFSFKRIMLPVVFGLLVVAFVIYKGVDFKVFESISWGTNTFVCLGLALLMMACRDIGYILRIRVLTDNKLTWKQSINTIFLWEFASSITPSVVGGSGVAIFILKKEKIELGKSTAIVMVTALLDELFYIITVPLVVLLVGMDNLFPVEFEKQLFGTTFGTESIFYIGFGFIVLLTSIIGYAIFFNAAGFKLLLVKLTNISWLKKWQQKATETGDDIITTSKHLKHKPFVFWLKAFGATFLSWTARFWVVNFIILAFAQVTFGEHLLIYARQLVMWVILLISPTPGGSGVAEFIFSGFLSDFTPAGTALLMAVLWRLLSYYPYLLIGALILPGWLRKKKQPQ